MTATAARPRSLPVSPSDGLPPPLVPVEHFAAGVLWLLLGAAGLTYLAPQLAAGNFLQPRVIAVTHVFTLGVVTTSIFGALYQIFPVALGVSARSIRVAHWTFAFLQAGVIAMVAGAWWWRSWLLALGFVLLLLAVGGFSWNLLPQRRRAERGRAIGLYVSAGHMALGFAMFIAAARIGETLTWWTVDRFGLLNAHAHLAVVGFATLTAVGVGSKLLPMFLLSRDYTEWPIRWIGPVVGSGLLVFSIGSIWSLPLLVWAGGVATAAGVGLYLFQVLDYYRHRTRDSLEPGPALAACAVVFLGAALALGVVLLILPGIQPRLIVAYGILGVVGWLVLLVVGVYYKIFPVLTWMHRFSPRVGAIGLPTIADLSMPLLAWITVAVLPLGVTVMAAGAAFGAPLFVHLGASAFFLGVLVAVAHHFRMLILSPGVGKDG